MRSLAIRALAMAMERALGIINRKSAGLLMCLLALLVPVFADAFAADIKIDHQGLSLVGDLDLAAGKNLSKDGVVLLLHDVLSHKHEQNVDELRAALLAKGVNVLAINLSLGLEGRQGRFDCAVEQDHLYSDALPEIHAWIKYLQSRKVRHVALLGIGHGANQMALYGSKTTQKSVRSLILLAPSVSAKKRMEEQYQQLHGKSLSDILFDAEEKIASQRAGELLAGVGFLSCPKARVTARSFVSYYGENQQFEVIPLIASIRKPVLVLSGELGEAATSLLQAMARLDARATLKFDVIEAADAQFSGVAMGQVADRIKLFGDETRGK